MKMKYVMFDELYPVIFDPPISHDAIRVNMMEATSAGFVNIYSSGSSSDRCITVNISGESISLGLKPNDEDSEIIQKLFDTY